MNLVQRQRLEHGNGHHVALQLLLRAQTFISVADVAYTDAADIESARHDIDRAAIEVAEHLTGRKVTLNSDNVTQSQEATEAERNVTILFAGGDNATAAPRLRRCNNPYFGNDCYYMVAALVNALALKDDYRDIPAYEDEDEFHTLTDEQESRQLEVDRIAAEIVLSLTGKSLVIEAVKSDTDIRITV